MFMFLLGSICLVGLCKAVLGHSGSVTCSKIGSAAFLWPAGGASTGFTNKSDCT